MSSPMQLEHGNQLLPLLFKVTASPMFCNIHFSQAMSNAGDSGSYRSILPWLHRMEEYESDEKVEFVMDDDDEMALYMAMMQDEDSSRRCPPPQGHWSL
jgi:hypothetical protein